MAGSMARVHHTEIALPIIVGTVAIHLGKKVGYTKVSYRSSQLMPELLSMLAKLFMSARPSPCLGPC
jgi:hypothetical protein